MPRIFGWKVISRKVIPTKLIYPTETVTEVVPGGGQIGMQPGMRAVIEEERQPPEGYWVTGAAPDADI